MKTPEDGDEDPMDDDAGSDGSHDGDDSDGDDDEEDGDEDGDEEEGDKADGDGEGGGSVGPFGTSTKLRFYSDHKHLVTRARRRKDGESAVAFVSNPSSR